MCRALIWREYNCAEEWEVALSLWPKKQVKPGPNSRYPPNSRGGRTSWETLSLYGGFSRELPGACALSHPSRRLWSAAEEWSRASAAGPAGLGHHC